MFFDKYKNKKQLGSWVSFLSILSFLLSTARIEWAINLQTGYVGKIDRLRIS